MVVYDQDQCYVSSIVVSGKSALGTSFGFDLLLMIGITYRNVSELPSKAFVIQLIYYPRSVKEWC